MLAETQRLECYIFMMMIWVSHPNQQALTALMTRQGKFGLAVTDAAVHSLGCSPGVVRRLYH